MNLLTPTDHQDAYEWAAVLLAHGFIGLVLVALVAAVLEAWAGEWIDDLGRNAWVLVVAVYAAVWEGTLQPIFGDQVWLDAFIDTLAIACGGAVGVFLWKRQAFRAACVTAVLGLALWLGVRSRK